jgi:protocatechuate 3,4-dioxygenase, beta subunit
MDRRIFIHRAATFCFGSAWMSRMALAEDRVRTPSQTRGPFYPIPAIEKQEFFDVDLTRKSEDSPIAEGEIIAIRGNVLDLTGRSLNKVIVEVWQACVTGRYNHPNDDGKSKLDPNFQYWGRMITGDDGAFSFKTIQPGKYPGRTPHIHFRIVPADREALETQLYFEDNHAYNEKDGIYMGVSPEQRRAVTTALEKVAVDANDPKSEKLPTGNFQIVLGPKTDTKSTPGM